MPEDVPDPLPQRFPVAHAHLHPCNACGARAWHQGLSYYLCAACGYRQGPTPAEILLPEEPSEEA